MSIFSEGETDFLLWFLSGKDVTTSYEVYSITWMNAAQINNSNGLETGARAYFIGEQKLEKQ